MYMRDIMDENEVIGVEAHVRVAESTYNQCLSYKDVADLEGYLGGEIREDGTIIYILSEIDEEFSEGVNEEVPHRLLKMLEKAIKAGADYLVLTPERSGEVFAA